MVEGLPHPWIVKEVLTIPLSKFPHKDRLVWMHNKLGKFSVKSCYHMLHERKEGCGLSASSSSSQI